MCQLGGPLEGKRARLRIQLGLKMARHRRPRVDVVAAVMYAVWALFLVVVVIYALTRIFS